MRSWSAGSASGRPVSAGSASVRLVIVRSSKVRSIGREFHLWVLLLCGGGFDRRRIMQIHEPLNEVNKFLDKD